MMKNFKKFTYCYMKHPMCGKVYHDKNEKRAVYTDGRFMILSNELYDESKDVETVKNNHATKDAETSFDYHSFKYDRVICSDDDIEEKNSSVFASQCKKIDVELFDKDVPYDDCRDKIMFADFNFVLTLYMVHTINEFVSENSGRILKFYVNKNDICKSMCIKVFELADDIFSDEFKLVNAMYFMPVNTGNDYNFVIKNDTLEAKEGTWNKDVEKLYSWSDMANALTEHGIPHSVVSGLADLQMASILNRPIFNIFKFDDYLHDRFGAYEEEQKSMKDIFIQLFGDDVERIKYFFGISSDK